jgi:NAD(P)-dependent dehydrogenase (short-subunit alcohol dehydrogenase family)
MAEGGQGPGPDAAGQYHVGIATGGGRGMGLECGRRMARLVDHVLLVDRDEATVSRAAAELAGAVPASVEPVIADVTDRDDLGRLAARAGELGTLRAVAHAAGISPTMADWRRIFEVDLVGTALVAQALRPLATAGTAMVCFSSMSAVLRPGQPQDAELDKLMADPLQDGFLGKVRDLAGPDIETPGLAYSLAKRGVKVFVQREAVRLGPAGARVCSVSPGIIDTPQGRQEAARHPSMAAMIAQTPLARMGQAGEVASVVEFLLGEEAGFLNGVDILIDGGVVAAIASARGGWLSSRSLRPPRDEKGRPDWIRAALPLPCTPARVHGRSAAQ